MNKLQAMTRIMMVLNEDGRLKPGSQAYKIIRKMASDKIDRLGPEAAVTQIMDRKAQILAEIQNLCPAHEFAPERFFAKLTLP